MQASDRSRVDTTQFIMVSVQGAPRSYIRITAVPRSVATFLVISARLDEAGNIGRTLRLNIHHGCNVLTH